MNPALGQYALLGAVLVALGAFHATIAYSLTRKGLLLRVARASLVLLAGLFSVSLWALLAALLENNFGLEYVSQHSEAALPMFYKVAAVWAGQEGSLLLWAWMIAVMGVIVAFYHNARETLESAWTVGTIVLVLGFFAALLYFAGSPFAPAQDQGQDGQGLNPLLQNFAMVFHPPTLFLGYAGFTIPFALMVGALVAGRKDAGWLAEARPWILFSWISLTVGIILGAQWAYVVLGWGGYWAWDPVENASLLPWLTATALIHSLITWQKRGMLKLTTVALIAISFLLCFFGTYLTRSGIVQSVHAFGASPIGTFLLVFLALALDVSLTLILAQSRLLKSDRPLEEIFTREGVVLAGCILLTVMMLVTTLGTIFPVIASFLNTTLGRISPLIARFLGKEAANLGQPFYNKTILPMALLVAALMAIGPLVTYGAGALLRSRRSLAALGGAAAVAFLAGLAYVIVTFDPAAVPPPAPEALAAGASAAPPTLFWYTLTHLWTPAVAAVAVATVLGILVDFLHVVRLWIANTGDNPILAAIKVLDIDHRRWGGYVTHLGMAAIIVGVAGSALYNRTEEFTLDKGASRKIGNYTLTYQDFQQRRGPTFTAYTATLSLADAGGRKTILTPERRYYDKVRNPDQSYSEVSIDFGLRRDLYSILAGWSNNGNNAAFQVIINPLVNWIWIGGILLTLGGLFCMTPRLLPRTAEAVLPTPASEASANQAPSRRSTMTSAR